MKRVLKPELKAEHNREKINAHLYNANIKLQDENEMLKRDNEILQRRMERVIERLQKYDIAEDIFDILRGEYYE